MFEMVEMGGIEPPCNQYSSNDSTAISDLIPRSGFNDCDPESLRNTQSRSHEFENQSEKL